MARRVAIVAALALVVTSAPAQQGLSRDAQGWTVFSPSADSRLIYVSSSTPDYLTPKYYSPSDPEIGPDPFHPLGPIRAYPAITSGTAQARANFPDWVLLKRGDVWYESRLALKNGRSASERSLFGAYGDGPRPMMKIGHDRGWSSNNSLQFAAMAGIDIYAHSRDPNSPEYDGPADASGMGWLIPAGGYGISFLVEDCAFRFATVGWQMRSGGTTRDLVLRRSLILDTYSGDGSHCQGMFAYGLDGVLFEENIVDHCGWLSQGGSGGIGEATMFNHDTYYSETRNVTFRGNMFLRGASMGNKWRADYTGISPGIVLDNNLYVESELAIGIGGNTSEPHRFINPQITSNVIMHCGRTQPTGRTLGWNIAVSDWDGGLIANNIILRQDNPAVVNVYAINIGGDSTRNVTVRDNIVYNLWTNPQNQLLILGDAPGGGIVVQNNLIQSPGYPVCLVSGGALTGYTFTGNTYHSSRTWAEWFRLSGALMDFPGWQTASGEVDAAAEPVAFVDPDRTIETYNESQGFEPTMASFLEQVRQQGKHNWRPEYTAAVINDYIRAGFALAPSPPILDGYPLDDTWTRATGESPRGGESTMKTFTAANIGYSYVKFAIGDLAGKQVLRVMLRLFSSEISTSTMTIRDYVNNWNEETLTFDNVPAPSNSGAVIATFDATDAGWHEVDVTTTILTAVGAGQTEISFTLNTTGGVNRNWHTKENTSTHAPRLTVTYNRAPSFLADPFTKPDATEEQPYSASLAADATDPDQGNTLTFTKTGGPSWLAIAADGTLSGTPPVGAAGINTFGVHVEDAHGLSDDATFSIHVKPKVPVGLSAWLVF